MRTRRLCRLPLDRNFVEALRPWQGGTMLQAMPRHDRYTALGRLSAVQTWFAGANDISPIFGVIFDLATWRFASAYGGGGRLVLCQRDLFASPPAACPVPLVRPLCQALPGRHHERARWRFCCFLESGLKTAWLLTLFGAEVRLGFREEEPGVRPMPGPCFGVQTG